MRKGRLIALSLGAAMAVTAYAQTRPAPSRDTRVAEIAVRARPAPLNRNDPGQERVGRLRYMGGLVLTSRDRRFGGISGMLWEPACNRILAASDDGQWFVLTPEENGERLTGIAQAWTASFRRPGDAPIASKGEVDSEALARDDNGRVWAFFEQVHRAERFPAIDACRPETLSSLPDRIWMLPGTQGWAMNGGAEAAAGTGGMFVFLSESSSTVAGVEDRRGVIASPHEGAAGPRIFSYAAPSGFSPTDMDALNGDGADGRMLVLHRRLSGLGGFSAIVAEADLPAEGAGPVTPREIARLAAPLIVDNMEALAVRAEGERRFVYLMSDDNFKGFQRTLLLKFELLPEG